MHKNTLYNKNNRGFPGSSVVGLHTPSAGGIGSGPGWGTKNLQAMWHSPKNRKNKKNEQIIEELFKVLLSMLQICFVHIGGGGR